MKPLLTYYGGKQLMVKYILPLLPKHELYCEPFVGGGAVFWMKPDKARHEILNDLDEQLINFYRVAKLHPVALYALIDASLHSEADYARAKSILNDPEASDLNRAWAYFVRTQQSFCKGLDRGWGRAKGGSSPIGVEWNNKKKKIVECVERLSQVTISCCDATKCIKHFDNPSSFFYVDPPYIGTDCTAYKNKYTLDDYKNLIEVLKNIKGKFLLSNYEQLDVEMPKDWICSTVTLKRKFRPEANGGNAVTKVEYLWRNYDIDL